MTWLFISGLIGIGIVGLATFYALILRPWHLFWGATEEEVNQVLPGDDLVESPKSEATHAITIQAPASEVWPWLAQLGQDRAGFYSYTWLENLFGCHMRNTYRIVDEWQDLHSGDGVLFHPKLPPIPAPIVWPNEALVIGGLLDPQTLAAIHTDVNDSNAFTQTSWAFILREESQDRTRLIVRWRGRWPDGCRGWLENRLFWEPAHFIMERRMLLTIKRLAEEAFRATTKNLVPA